MKRFITLNEIDDFNMLPGFIGKLVHTENQTFSFWKIQKDAILPEHHHPHQQVSIVTKGKFELTIGTETKIMEQGMVAVIPSNEPHSGKAITDAEIMDVFYPVREEYKTGG